MDGKLFEKNHANFFVLFCFVLLCFALLCFPFWFDLIWFGLVWFVHFALIFLICFDLF